MPVQRTVLGKGLLVDQGDLLEDVEFVEYAIEKQGIIEVSKIVFPTAVVLAQTCDAHEDYAIRWGRGTGGKPRKAMLSYLVAPVYNAAQLMAGTHLIDLGMELKKLESRTEMQSMRNNAHPRYHYLEFGADVPVADAIVDFKHYFTASPAHLRERKKNGFIRRLAVPHREALSNRFAAWTSRVGLPD